MRKCLSPVILTLALLPFLSTADTCRLNTYDKLNNNADFSPYKGIYGTIRLDDDDDLGGQLKLNGGFKYLFYKNWDLYVSYSAAGIWNIQDDSGPFQDINHNPELFQIIDSQLDPESLGVRCLQWGYEHISNGVDNDSIGPDGRNNRSRSVHNINLQTYHVIGRKNGTTVFSPKIWWNFYKEDNTGIDDYYGNIDLRIAHTFIRNGGSDGDGDVDGGLMVSGKLRGSHKTGKGRLELGLSWPFPKEWNIDLFWYFEYFNGYGETLLDYDKQVESLRFGAMIARF